MSDVESDIADPQLALERARLAYRAFSSLEASSCPQELAAQLSASLNEMVQLAERLLAEKEQFRTRLHRSTTFSIPDNSGASAAL
jgi:hypothetical protein